MKGKDIFLVLTAVFFSSCASTHFNIDETALGADATASGVDATAFGVDATAPGADATAPKPALTAISNKNSDLVLQEENPITTIKTVAKSANDFRILASLAPLSAQTDHRPMDVQLPEPALTAISNKNFDLVFHGENPITTIKTVAKSANDFRILASLAPLSAQTDHRPMDVQLPEPHFPTINNPTIFNCPSRIFRPSMNPMRCQPKGQ